MNNTADDKFYIDYVINLAEENVKSGKGGPFAAVVVKDGKIVATGLNAVTRDNDPTAHAEIKAIRHACSTLNSYQLDDCVIYSSCEPCPMCLGAIYWARPARLVFAATKQEAAQAGFDDEFIYKEINKPLNMRRLSTAQLNVDKRTNPFRLWLSSLNRIEY